MLASYKYTCRIRCKNALLARRTMRTVARRRAPSCRSADLKACSASDNRLGELHRASGKTGYNSFRQIAGETKIDGQGNRIRHQRGRRRRAKLSAKLISQSLCPCLVLRGAQARQGFGKV